MASRLAKFFAATAVVLVGGSGYLIYSLFAAQAQNSTLAQAPLNTQVQVPPAFIMAVDDSGSMQFETMLAGPDGMACWSSNSFFSSGGVLNTCGTGTEYYNLFPYTGYNTQYTPARAVPPLDVFGFSRSHEFNASYFNPAVTYEPWLGSDFLPYPNATASAARVHPDRLSHNGGSLTSSTDFNLTADRTSNFTYMAGMPGGAATNRSVTYFPATFYLRENTPAPTGYRTADTYRPVITGACGTGCNMRRYEIRSANYTSAAHYNAAIQNFANWFQYHRTRRLAMIAAMSRAMLDVNNMRVGYFTINTGTSSDVVMRDMSVSTEKASLYTNFLALRGNGGTPNLNAVDHMGQQFQRTGTGAPVQFACQRNAGLLFTDGFASAGGPSAPSLTLPSPFNPTPADSMAAVASKYYFNSGAATVGLPGTSPLVPGFAAGLVPVPEACSTLSPTSTDWKRLNCQSNLHMSLYGITLGGRGDIFNPDLTQDPYVLNPSWPGHNGGQRSTVDDLWHATVNTRGEFVNAKTPADIVAAMRRVLSSVGSGASPSGSIAITGARIGTGSLQVTPSYDVRNEGTDWSGELTADRVRLNSVTRVPETVFAWRASERFPAHGSRDVFFSRATGTVQRFNSSNVTLADMCSEYACTPEQIGALGASATVANAVNYLLGDTTLEKRNSGPFRDRGTRLGDIVNSGPVVSSPTDNYGYVSLGTVGGIDYATTYSAYLTTKSTRRYMVYVGANDGMLHAFDGGLTKAMADSNQAPDSNGGREEFAYIPATSLGKMGNLLFPYNPLDRNDQKFKHRYYVDGPVVVSDAYYGANWRTVLVGTSGAGGRNVFALDVSDPGSFAESSRLWEISNLNTSLPLDVRNDIGHVLGKPIVVPVRNTAGTVTWKAIFGNGYESASGRAVLFMVDIGTGNPVITRVVAQESGAGLSSTSRNGLGNIVAVDRWGGSGLTSPVRDGFADTVYAADQQGALWKFDIRSATPANISIPLFRTQEHTESGGRYRQPIMGGLTAAAGANGGVMLYFGTGSFSFVNDPTDSYPQSLYAINDIERVPTTTTVALNTLVRYSVSAIVATPPTTDRTLTRTANPANARGWYVDLPARERFVGNPEIATGVIFMPTYSPSAVVSGCSPDGLNSLFGLNARSGVPALSSVRYGSPAGTSPRTGTASISLMTGGTAPVRDVGVMAIPRQGPPPLTAAPPGGPTPPPPPPPEQGCWMMVTVAGAQAMYLPYPCGRQSWRQIE